MYKNRRNWNPYAKAIKVGNQWGFNTLSELQEAIVEYEEREGISQQQAAQQRPYEVPGTKFILEDGDWKVYQILTYEGSLTFCAQAGWCVDNQSTFESTYGEDKGELFIFRFKDKSIALAFASKSDTSYWRGHEFKERFNKPLRPTVANAIKPLVLRIPALQKVVEDLREQTSNIARLIDNREGVDILKVKPSDIGARSSLAVSNDISFMQLANKVRKKFKEPDYIHILALRILREHRDQQQHIIGLTTLRMMEELSGMGSKPNKKWLEKATKLMFSDGFFMNSIKYNMNHGAAKVFASGDFRRIFTLLTRPPISIQSVNDYALFNDEFLQLAEKYGFHNREIHTSMRDVVERAFTEMAEKAIDENIKQKLSGRLGMENKLFRLLMEKAGLYTIVIPGLLKNDEFIGYVKSKVFNKETYEREHKLILTKAINFVVAKRYEEYYELRKKFAEDYNNNDIDDKTQEIIDAHRDEIIKWSSEGITVEGVATFMANRTMNDKYGDGDDSNWSWARPGEDSPDVQVVYDSIYRKLQKKLKLPPRAGGEIGESFDEFYAKASP